VLYEQRRAIERTCMSKLELIYDQLLTRATQSGTDQAANLAHGARLAVRYRASITTVTISRDQKRVGDTEIVTFRRVCRVPADAERIPSEGQGKKGGWHYVAFRWRDGGSDEGTQ
jgi:hypothetical protein